MYEEETATIQNYVQRLDELRTCLNVDKLNTKIGELEGIMAAAGFWDHPEEAQKTVKALKVLKAVVGAPDALREELEDAEVLLEMAAEEEDEGLATEITELREVLDKKLSRLELNSLFHDPRDAKKVLLSIHPGAGGTESCDWAEMLYRMYVRFCEQREFRCEVLDYQPGDEAGLKSATLAIEGPYAYGTFRSEDGVHRLVRISPFDSQSRRHTSFCAVEVLSEIDEDIEIEVREEDLKMDVFRASGAGGQKVNKTSSAVRLTHQPSGIVVSCQSERSQHRNRDTAIQMLKSKLYDIEMKKLEAELASQREGQQDVAWGSEIRSYVLQPYQMIKDHRTLHETGNVTRVLDGGLDPFIEAYLKWDLERHSKL